jgi:hypothetical protein
MNEADSRLPGFMELRFALTPPKPSFTPKYLLDAARAAEIHTFGWPIGIVLDVDEYRPRPTVDGVTAEVDVAGQSYDYWSFRTDGDYFLLKSLFEDGRVPESLFADTRIVQVTEAFLFCARLYTHLGVDPGKVVHIAVRHGGLRGRTLRTANPARHLSMARVTTEAEVGTERSVTLGEIDSQLVELVKQTCAPLFMVFDFLEIGDPVYEDLITSFVAGRVG